MVSHLNGVCLSIGLAAFIVIISLAGTGYFKADDNNTLAPTAAPTTTVLPPYDWVSITSGYCVSSTACVHIETIQQCQEAQNILFPSNNQPSAYPVDYGNMVGCTVATNTPGGVLPTWFQSHDTGTTVECGQFVAGSAIANNFAVADYNPACICDCRFAEG